MTYGPFYRFESNEEGARLMFESREIWGRARRHTNSGLYPAVKAYESPEGKSGWGVKFTTNVPPGPESFAPPSQVQWSGNRPGVVTFEIDNDDCVKIQVLAIEYYP